MLTSRPTHGGGAPFGIDLDAGIARITVPRPASPAAAVAAEPPAEEAPSAEPSGSQPRDAADEPEA